MSGWGVSTGHNNILAHDSTPVDNAISQVSPHFPYEPSTGAPRRAFGRSQGFTRAGVPDSEAPASHAKQRHEAVRKPAVTVPAHPGHAQSAADFFAGQHSTPYRKNGDARGVAHRFVDPSVYEEETRLDREYKQEVGRIATHQQRIAEQRRENERIFEEQRVWGC